LAKINELQLAAERWRQDIPDVNAATMRAVEKVDKRLAEEGDIRPYTQRWDLALREVRGVPSPYFDWGERVQLGGIASPETDLHNNAVSIVRFVRTGSWAKPEVEDSVEVVNGVIGEMAEARGGRRVERATHGMARWLAED
jgi:hypothetical protein